MSAVRHHDSTILYARRTATMAGGEWEADVKPGLVEMLTQRREVQAVARPGGAR